jgi:7-keto-8-aminopelargonate synthetase-like enzyme
VIVNYPPVSQLDEAIIVPVIVGDAEPCKAAADHLLERHAIYIQPIKLPHRAPRHGTSAHHTLSLPRGGTP